MKINRVIFFIIIMQFVTGVLCSPVFAVYPGSFDFNNNTAYILEVPKKGDRVIRYIDFKDKTEKIIKSGFFLREPAINHEREIISFVSKKNINFYDVEKEVVFFTVPKISGSKITWDDSGNKISYYDSSSHVIMEVDINNREVIKIPFSGIMFQTKWDVKNNSFLYQLMDKYPNDDVSNLDAKIMRNVDGKLEEYKGVKTLSMSPNGEYYYEGKEYPEEGNVVSFYKSDGDNLISLFGSTTSLGDANEVWGKDTVRFLFQGGVFDLKTGKLITYTHNFWPEEGPRPKKINPRRDMAADWNNYVLMWNTDAKIFEVEDINTGKIIKTYKKFW